MTDLYNVINHPNHSEFKGLFTKTINTMFEKGSFWASEFKKPSNAHFVLQLLFFISLCGTKQKGEGLQMSVADNLFHPQGYYAHFSCSCVSVLNLIVAPNLICF